MLLLSQSHAFVDGRGVLQVNSAVKIQSLESEGLNLTSLCAVTFRWPCKLSVIIHRRWVELLGPIPCLRSSAWNSLFQGSQTNFFFRTRLLFVLDLLSDVVYGTNMNFASLLSHLLRTKTFSEVSLITLRWRKTIARPASRCPDVAWLNDEVHQQECPETQTSS